MTYRIILVTVLLGLGACAASETNRVDLDDARAAYAANPPGPAPTVEGPNTSVQPLQLPRPGYPVNAIKRGLQGECLVTLDVTATGKPTNIDADCTDYAFKVESIRTMSKVTFPMLEVDGVATPYSGIEYPLEFRIGS